MDTVCRGFSFLFDHPATSQQPRHQVQGGKGNGSHAQTAVGDCQQVNRWNDPQNEA